MPNILQKNLIIIQMNLRKEFDEWQICEQPDELEDEPDDELSSVLSTTLFVEIEIIAKSVPAGTV